jgi:VanZ family protein
VNEPPSGQRDVDPHPTPQGDAASRNGGGTGDEGASGTIAWPLLWAWAFLVVYASLFPFEGWTLPQGLAPQRLLALPWPTWRDRFDEVANLLGYVPFGGLACAVVLRRGHGQTRSLVVAVLAASALSYTVEVAQVLMPSRVPSLKDTAFNVAGAAIGAAAAAVLLRARVGEPWQRLRDGWFEHRSPFAQTLLLLWPAALLVPVPVPLGLGHVWDALTRALADIVTGTPLANQVDLWIEAMQPAGERPGVVMETVIVALGLAGPCLLSFVLAAPVRRRLLLIAGAVSLAFAVTTVSTALSFGPEHALAWWTPRVALGLLAGAITAAACLKLSARQSAVASTVVLAAMLLLVTRAPADPYYAEFLSTWEQGRFVRFHGVAQWLTWTWPFAAIVWLLPRALGLRR